MKDRDGDFTGSRQLLVRWENLGVPTFRLPEGFGPSKVKGVLETVEKANLAKTAKLSPGIDLDEVRKVLADAWNQRNGFAGLSSRARRHAPWALFTPIEKGVRDDSRPENRYSILVRRIEFCEAYIATEKREGNLRRISKWILAFLRHYPIYIETFTYWRELLRRSLLEDRSRSLDIWRERERKFDLFASSAPVSLAGRVRLTRNGPGSALSLLLQEIGFQGSLEASPFVQQLIRATLHRLEGALQRREVPAEDLETFIRNLPFKEDSLGSQDIEKTLAEALIRPHLQRPPSESIQSVIVDVLLKKLGDPRISGSRWLKIEQPLRDGFARWLVRQTFSAFFSLIDQTARQDHWTQRKDFWMRQLDSGCIRSAWIVLGYDARSLLGGKNSGLEYGRLQKGSGVQWNHSALLMEIVGPVGSLVAVEWSHEGGFRTWRRGKAEAPPLHQKTYSGSQLRRASTGYIPHVSGWQFKVQDHLRREIGLSPR